MRAKGLVLEGGGAKGAFAFGVLRAFHELGVTFQAVAGTSVGALNAVIWATASMSEGERLWRDLNVEKVFDAQYPRFLQPFIRVAVLIARLWSSIFEPRMTTDGLRIPQRALVFLTALPAGYFMWHNSPLYPAMNWILVLTTAFGAACLVEYADRGLVGGRGHVISLVGLACLFFVVFQAAHKSAGIPGTFLMGAIAVFVLYVMARPVYNVQPLRQLLAPFLQKPLWCKLYVTTGVERTLWAVDRSEKSILTLPAGVSMDVRTKYREYVPVYHDVGSLPENLRLDTVVASAALPLGIVSSITLNGEPHVDGGVADNTPIFPLLNGDSLDVIVVVHLSTKQEAEMVSPQSSSTDVLRVPAICESMEHLTALWSRLDRLIHLAKYCQNTAYKPSDFDIVPERSFRSSKVAPKMPVVLHLFPSESLGGFIDGTMNFDADRARRLIELGFDAGLRFARANEMQN